MPANLSFSGEAAGGEYSQPHGSSKNDVRNSLITNSLCRYNVDSFYPLGSLTPVGNSVHDSCVWNAPFGNFGDMRTQAVQSPTPTTATSTPTRSTSTAPPRTSGSGPGAPAPAKGRESRLGTSRA